MVKGAQSWSKKASLASSGAFQEYRVVPEMPKVTIVPSRMTKSRQLLTILRDYGRINDLIRVIMCKSDTRTLKPEHRPGVGPARAYVPRKPATLAVMTPTLRKMAQNSKIS